MAGLTPPVPVALRREVLASLAGALALGLLIATFWADAAAGARRFGLLMALAALWIWRRLPEHAPHHRWGWANQVTAARGWLLLLWLAWGWDAPVLGWGSVVLGTVFLLADGLDGALARRQRTASPFGARFDLEVDALFVLVASLLLLRAGSVGAWILLGALLRYGYLAAGYRWRALRAPLPPSRRRAICGVMHAALLTAGSAPILPVGLVQAMLLLGLLLVGASFLIDVRAQLARPSRTVLS
jgi:phosphatidylglycerophosphate synthase